MRKAFPESAGEKGAFSQKPPFVPVMGLYRNRTGKP